MKRTTAILLAALFGLLFSITAFADNVYVVEDDDNYVPPTTAPATTQPAETTTSPLSGIDSLIDRDAIDGYLGNFSDKIGSGIDSILSRVEGGLDQWQAGNTADATTQSSASNGSISYTRPASSHYSQSLTTVPAAENTAETTASALEEGTTSAPVPEVASVLIVNQAQDNPSGVSGSMLTLIVFVAAVVILVLAAVIALILMTRRTEFNSAVMNKSTIPSAPQPRTLSEFLNDDIADDGKDYGNIAYWNDRPEN